ncbi:hypothetical protein ACA350_11530 [Orientia tsutsugamushi]|uniref:hypothetical protein n=1 Tax=Orientia tsutsugamushi TaxID=784 RepID=UPI003527A57B
MNYLNQFRKRSIEENTNTNFIHEEYQDGFVGAKLISEITEVFLAAAIYIFIFEQKQVATIADQIVKQAKNIGTRWIVTILRGQIELQNAHSKKFSIQKLLKDTINSLKEIAEDGEISLSYNVQDNINDIVIVEIVIYCKLYLVN